MNKKHQFVTNTLSTVVFRLVSMAIGFVVIPVFVANLGAEIYGIWVLSGILMGYIGLFKFGVGGGVVKYIAEYYTKHDNESIRKVIDSSVLLFVLLSFVIFIVIFIGAELLVNIFKISPENIPLAVILLKIAAVFTLFYWPLSVFDNVLRGIVQFIPLNIITGIETVVKSVSVLILAILDVDVIIIFIVFNSVSLVSWMIKFVFAKFKLPMITLVPWTANWASIKEIFSFSFFVFIQEIISLIATKSHHIIIGIYLPIVYLTTYTVITKLYYMVHQVTGMFLSVIWPTIFSANTINDRKLIESVIIKGSHYITFIVLPITATCIVIVEPFLEMWMGTEYSSYAYLCQLLLMVWIIGPAGGIFGNVAIGLGRIKALNVWGIAGVTLNILFSILAIQHVGFPGVILSAVSVSLLTLPLKYPWFMRILGVNWKAVFFPLFIQIALSVIMIIGGKIFLDYLQLNYIHELLVFSTIFALTHYLVSYQITLKKKYKQEIQEILYNMLKKVRTNHYE